MPQVTLLFGALMVLVGLVGYFGQPAEHASKTALIPAGFGLAFLLAGAVALQPSLRKHAMHAAAVLGLLCFLGGFSGLMKLPTLLSGGELERPRAVVSQSILSFLGLVFVILCVRSFIAARRASRAEGSQG